MKIGIPKEIKNREYRVAATPDCVRAYVAQGNSVVVQQDAGLGAGFENAEYEAAGAKLVADAAMVWASSDMIVKVKEPLPSEYDLMRPGQLLFTYLHLAAVPELALALMRQRVTAVAYETIEMADGTLPCLVPMSAIAGRLSVQQGAKYLEKQFGGRGVLLGGVPGVERGKVVVLGGGVVGTHAAKMAVGLGADVTILELSHRRLAELDDLFGGRVQTLVSNEGNLVKSLAKADLVIGAVLVTGARAPKLIRREHLKGMLPGSLIVDVAIDQGGCAETIRATTHDEPIYEVDRVLHYAVPNMPAAVARTSTQALTSTTLPYGLLLAARGFEAAAAIKPELAPGLNAANGKIMHPVVAAALAIPQAA
ncbi:MAG TPA: alanine dehydrogenase [Polyangiales bacterium]|nr:alanine dehydrogenase [Polyangiales bacterium]